MQPGRSTESLAGARTVDYSDPRGSHPVRAVPSSAMRGRTQPTTENSIDGRGAEGTHGPGALPELLYIPHLAAALTQA